MAKAGARRGARGAPRAGSRGPQAPAPPRPSRAMSPFLLQALQLCCFCCASVAAALASDSSGGGSGLNDGWYLPLTPRRAGRGAGSFPSSPNERKGRKAPSLPPPFPHGAGVCASWKWFLLGERGDVAGTLNLSKESMPQASGHLSEEAVLSLLTEGLVKSNSCCGEELERKCTPTRRDNKRRLLPLVLPLLGTPNSC